MTCSTRVSTRSVLSPVSDFLGMTYGSTRTKCSGNSRDGSPRSFADRRQPRPEAVDVVLVDVHADVQPSVSPSTISGWFGGVPTNSPGRTFTCRTVPATGARTISRSRSIRVCATWASAWATAAWATALSASQAPALSRAEVRPGLGQLGLGRRQPLLAGEPVFLADRVRPDQLLGPGELVGLELHVGLGLAHLGLAGRHLLGPRHLLQPQELRLRRRQVGLAVREFGLAVAGRRAGRAARRP